MGSGTLYLGTTVGMLQLKVPGGQVAAAPRKRKWVTAEMMLRSQTRIKSTSSPHYSLSYHQQVVLGAHRLDAVTPVAGGQRRTVQRNSQVELLVDAVIRHVGMLGFAPILGTEAVASRSRKQAADH